MRHMKFKQAKLKLKPKLKKISESSLLKEFNEQSTYCVGNIIPMNLVESNAKDGIHILFAIIFCIKSD